ncbi:MAG: GNAT family N-acetyltransferase, partial [Rhizomicrobium sp.]
FSVRGFIVTISNDIQSFAPAWPKLRELEKAENARSYAFQCRDHLEIWLETIGAERQTRPLFVSVSDDAGHPVMMIPLGIEKHNGVRFLGFLDGGVVDYNAPVLFGSAAGLAQADAVALWSSILRLAPAHDVVVLQKVPQYVGDIPNPFYKLAAEPWPASGYFLTLDPGHDNRALQRSTYAADNRRQRKRLSEIGELRFGIARNEREIADVFDTFVRQKSRRYAETGADNGLDVPAKRAYYSALAQRLSNGNGVQLSYLSVDHHIVATHWGLVAGRRFYYLMPAYEAGIWRKFSPGRLLMEELVAWSYDNGIEAFDLGIGDEEYKLKWRAQAIALSGGLFPITIVGRTYCAVVQARGALKRRLPPGVIRVIKSLQTKTHKS